MRRPRSQMGHVRSAQKYQGSAGGIGQMKATTQDVWTAISLRWWRMAVMGILLGDGDLEFRVLTAVDVLEADGDNHPRDVESLAAERHENLVLLLHVHGNDFLLPALLELGHLRPKRRELAVLDVGVVLLEEGEHLGEVGAVEVRDDATVQRGNVSATIQTISESKRSRGLDGQGAPHVETLARF